MADITNYYPKNILEEEHKNRSIMIFVKSNSFTNNISEMKRVLDDIGKSETDTNSQTNTPSDIFEASATRSGKNKKINFVKTEYGVALPLPNQLNENQNHEWSTSEGFIGKLLGAWTDIGGASSKLGELSQDGGFRKPLVNPGYFQDYRGTRPREFNFTWDFVPNNEQEARQIISIVYNLKKYTLPTSTVTGVGLLSPYMFDIVIGNKYINSLMNMNNVICTVMGLNYSADNSLQFFADGIPKYMTLNMTFAERSTVTADYYNTYK